MAFAKTLGGVEYPLESEQMAQLTDTLLQQMVDAIVDEVDPEQVILFGSRARGRLV